ncbi:nucleolar protein NOP52 variant [Zopfia rhizophila CBS 207.26]|uniref:Nucleolar protein NOP52 variant n=1 Tax=Zopfia rhizophila CBS 207.26 TaxID=1314779 RepID=A0A6A6EC00_9PEZI|nr:nucleolar protein NOP52 variant [Zopfia rhizophila CBS 207.26]
MTADPQNSPFIKHLASSDKLIRDSALDSLRTYLSGRSEISEIDLLKLWKGLFYCMWMQDKPLHQQHLARDLASLVEVLQQPVVLPFLDSFWKTIAREWGGIEALRMDKYLFLIRQYLNASFRYLSRQNWNNEAAIEQYAEILEETPLNVLDVKIPNGLRYHVLDIYIDELEKVGAEKLECIPLEKLLEPVRRLEGESKVKSVRNAAKETLDDDRLKAWRGEEVHKEMREGGSEDDEWGGIDD